MFKLPTTEGYIAEYKDKKGRTQEIEESLDTNKDVCKMKAERFIRKNKLKNIEYTITKCIF